MSRSILLRTIGMLLLALVLAGGWIFNREILRTFSDDPTVWEPEVAAFEAADRESPPLRDAILFVGSSSIRFWHELESDMAPLRVIRRGFGGARLSDLVHFADRIISPYLSYAPRAIVIHAGGNELTEAPGSVARTPSEAHQEFRALIAMIRSQQSDIPIYYLALRPSNIPGPRDLLLQLIEADCAAQPGLHYLDASAPLALADGSPDPSLITWDYIHLNRDGYEAWAPAIRERLLLDLDRGPASPDAQRSRS